MNADDDGESQNGHRWVEIAIYFKMRRMSPAVGAGRDRLSSNLHSLRIEAGFSSWRARTRRVCAVILRASFTLESPQPVRWTSATMLQNHGNDHDIVIR